MLLEFINMYKRIRKLFHNTIMIFKNFYEFWKRKYDDAVGKNDGIQFYSDEIYDEPDYDAWESIFPEPNINNDVEVKVDLQDKIIKFQNDMVYYKITGERLKIMINENKTIISELTKVNIVGNPVYRIVERDDKIGAISVVKVMNMTVSVTCNHVWSMLDMLEMKKYASINKMIVIDTGLVNLNNYYWYIMNNEDVMWYTKDLNSNKHLYCECKVDKFINVNINRNNRQRLATVAIVVSIQLSKELLYSGTNMIVNSKPFIVTYVNHNEKTGVTNIVAIAMFAHDYEICIED